MNKTRDAAGLALFLIALIAFLAIGLSNLGQPILEQHSFRQTQTALTSYWLFSNGFSFAYETPVVGYPWSVPFELPLFQALVAGFAYLGGIGLDPAGRLVSLLSTLAVCVPLYASLRLVGIDRAAANYANALYLSAPTYLFWSSTFMIEGFAVLLTAASCYYLLKMFQQGVRTRDLALFGVLLAMALLQKVTTAAIPALVGLAVFGLRPLLRLRAGGHFWSNQMKDSVRVLLVAAMAFAVALLWVRYTDLVKQRNEIGRFLTSGALAAWNYGTLEQRFSAAFLNEVLLKRILLPSTAHGMGLIALAMVGLLAIPRAYKLTVAACLALFLLPMAIFTNLHYVHDYYQSANLVFLMVAVGLAVYAVCGLLPSHGRWAAPIVMAAFVVGNFAYFAVLYYPLKSATISVENSRTLRIAAFLKAHTGVGAQVMVFGYDWSSEISYYAERKALAVPPWSKLETEAVRSPQRFLTQRPAAIVLCPTANAEELRSTIRASFPGSAVSAVDDCQIYLPPQI